MTRSANSDKTMRVFPVVCYGCGIGVGVGSDSVCYHRKAAESLAGMRREGVREIIGLLGVFCVIHRAIRTLVNLELLVCLVGAAAGIL